MLYLCFQPLQTQELHKTSYSHLRRYEDCNLTILSNSYRTKTMTYFQVSQTITSIPLFKVLTDPLGLKGPLVSSLLEYCSTREVKCKDNLHCKYLSFSLLILFQSLIQSTTSQFYNVCLIYCNYCVNARVRSKCIHKLQCHLLHTLFSYISSFKVQSATTSSVKGTLGSA